MATDLAPSDDRVTAADGDLLELPHSLADRDLDTAPALEPATVRIGRALGQPRPRLAKLTLVAITLGCLAFYLVHALVAQWTFYTTGYDLGIFDQAVRAYAHFKAPMVPLKGTGYNIFGDHFHPIIATLAPLYWIWDSPNMLLIAQAVLTAATIPVVYRFTRRRTGEAFSLLVAAAFGLGWPIQGLIDFDFHEVAFATPLLALAIDALDRRDDRRLVLWCVLLLFVREDMGVLVAILGLLRLFQRREGRRRPNPRLVLGLVVGGAAMYLLTTKLIIPHFSVAGQGFAYADQFGSLGNSIGSAAANVIMHPWHAATVFFTPSVKAKTLGFLILPLALLPLRSPYVLLAVPLMAERFFNTRGNLWTATFHYNALPWLVLVLAMVDGAHRLGLFERGRRPLQLRAALAALLVATPLLLPTIGWWDNVQPITKLRQGGPLTPSAGTRQAQSVVAFIPKDVCVAVDSRLAPHLTAKDWTTVPETYTYDPDFIALNMNSGDTGGNPPAPTPFEVLMQAQANNYKIVYRAGPFLVLRSPHYTGPSAQCAPLGPGKRAPSTMPTTPSGGGGPGG